MEILEKIARIKADSDERVARIIVDGKIEAAKITAKSNEKNIHEIIKILKKVN